MPLERIIRHRRAAGSAVSQRTHRHAGSIVAGIFAVVRRRAGPGLSRIANPTNGTDMPLVPQYLIVAEPWRLKAGAGKSLVLDVVRGKVLERSIEKDSIQSPGATRPAQGASAKFISPRERMCVLI